MTGFGRAATATDDTSSSNVARAAIMNPAETITKSVGKGTIAMLRKNRTDAFRPRGIQIDEA
ncbi:hypothetical protein MEX01_54320 [Methylorubrum extorquens]|nr:hypothetical protein MEX01_54320 [Methylorubrum extorquens]